MPRVRAPATRQEPEFQGTVDLAAQFDALFAGPEFQPPNSQAATYQRIWTWAYTPPPRPDGPTGVGRWQAMAWFDAVRYGPDDPLGHGFEGVSWYWDRQDHTELYPGLLVEPSGYGDIPVPLPQVAAVRALELDARVWTRYADSRPGAAQDRKARKWAQQHRDLAGQIQAALDRFGTGWVQTVEAEVAVAQTAALTQTPKRKAKLWH